jgi:hypothetical protein
VLSTEWPNGRRLASIISEGCGSRSAIEGPRTQTLQKRNAEGTEKSELRKISYFGEADDDF